MLFDLVIFDFDGTLVDSNEAKREAFFDLFPSEPPYSTIVLAVLGQWPEASREFVVPEMIRRMRDQELAGAADMQADAIIRRYGEQTEEAVQKSAEMAGASALLRALQQSGVKVAISSNTPHETLGRLVAARGWTDWLVSATGTPATKAATAVRLLAETGVPASRTAVVGDGESDRESARSIGATFFPVRETGDLQRLGLEWGVLSV